jgi:hypothetical protein
MIAIARAENPAIHDHGDGLSTLPAFGSAWRARREQIVERVDQRQVGEKQISVQILHHDSLGGLGCRMVGLHDKLGPVGGYLQIKAFR